VASADTSTGGAGSWDWWGTLGGLAGNYGPKPLGRQNRATLEAAGWHKGKRHGVWIGPQGEKIVGKDAARRMARAIRRAGGPTPADRPPSYVTQTIASVALPTLVVTKLAQRKWRQAAKKKKAKLKKSPRLIAAGKIAAELAKRYPKLGAGLRFAKGNLYLAAAYVGINWGIEEAQRWYRNRDNAGLERVKVTAKRVPYPKDQLSRVVVRAKRIPVPTASPYGFPTTVSIPGRAGSAVRVLPRPAPGAVATPVLSPVVVTAKRIPMPAPAPAPSVWSRAGSILWSTVGKPYVDQKLVQFGQPKVRKQRLPAVNPFYGPAPGQAPLTAVQPFAVPSAAPEPARKKCRCPTKRKKSGPRKRRSICYKGSYTETATGLRKHKREQVPC